MKWTVLAMAGALLASCAPAAVPAVFRDPVTGQVQQCTSNTGGGFFPIINGMTAQREIESCAASYSRMGWTRQ